MYPIVIASGTRLYRDGLAALLTAHGEYEVLAKAASGEEAICAVADRGPRASSSIAPAPRHRGHPQHSPDRTQRGGARRGRPGGRCLHPRIRRGGDRRISRTGRHTPGSVHGDRVGTTRGAALLPPDRGAAPAAAGVARRRQRRRRRPAQSHGAGGTGARPHRAAPRRTRRSRAASASRSPRSRTTSTTCSRNCRSIGARRPTQAAPVSRVGWPSARSRPSLDQI